MEVDCQEKPLVRTFKIRLIGLVCYHGGDMRSNLSFVLFLCALMKDTGFSQEARDLHRANDKSHLMQRAC